jgi:hypothetical protein
MGPGELGLGSVMELCTRLTSSLELLVSECLGPPLHAIQTRDLCQNLFFFLPKAAGVVWVEVAPGYCPTRSPFSLLSSHCRAAEKVWESFLKRPLSWIK